MGKRIEFLISLVPPGLSVIDIGTDHGKVTMGLAERNDIEKILATDISEKSIEKLTKGLGQLEASLRDKISIAITDGLRGLEKEQGDLILISGMGGALIVDILTKSMKRASKSSYWLLSPQSDIEAFRSFLQSLSYEVEEYICKEGRHYYPIFLVKLLEKRKAESVYNQNLSDLQLKYGPLLIKSRNKILLDLMERDLAALERVEKALIDGGADKAVISEKRIMKAELVDLIKEMKG